MLSCSEQNQKSRVPASGRCVDDANEGGGDVPASARSTQGGLPGSLHFGLSKAWPRGADFPESRNYLTPEETCLHSSRTRAGDGAFNPEGNATVGLCAEPASGGPPEARGARFGGNGGWGGGGSPRASRAPSVRKPGRRGPTVHGRRRCPRRQGPEVRPLPRSGTPAAAAPRHRRATLGVAPGAPLRAKIDASGPVVPRPRFPFHLPRSTGNGPSSVARRLRGRSHLGSCSLRGDVASMGVLRAWVARGVAK